MLCCLLILRHKKLIERKMRQSRVLLAILMFQRVHFVPLRLGSFFWPKRILSAVCCVVVLFRFFSYSLLRFDFSSHFTFLPNSSRLVVGFPSLVDERTNIMGNLKRCHVKCTENRSLVVLRFFSFYFTILARSRSRGSLTRVVLFNASSVGT